MQHAVLALVHRAVAAQVAFQLGLRQWLVLGMDQPPARFQAVIHLVLAIAEHGFPATGEEEASGLGFPVPDTVPGAIQGEAPAFLAELQFDFALAQRFGALGHQRQGVLPLVDHQQQVARQQQREYQAADRHQIGRGQRLLGEEVRAGHHLQQVLAVAKGQHATLRQIARWSHRALVDQLLAAILADIADAHHQARQVVRRDGGFHLKVEAEHRHHETAQALIAWRTAVVDRRQHDHAAALSLHHAHHPHPLGNADAVAAPRLGDGGAARRTGVQIQPQRHLVDTRGHAVVDREILLPGRAHHQAIALQVADDEAGHSLFTSAGLELLPLASGDSRHPGIGQGVAQQRTDESLEFAKGDFTRIAEKALDGIQLLELSVQTLLDAADTFASSQVETRTQLVLFGVAHRLAEQETKRRTAEDRQQADQPHQRAAGQHCRQGQFFRRKRLHAHFSNMGVEIPSL
ncbi:hypothetical protein D9M72_406880 [compost metagenome]